MWRITMWVFVGVVLWGLVSCSISCPDGKVCSDHSTCCMTEDGYACCQYPHEEKSSVVHCDYYYACPDYTTCCRHPKGAWFCCPYLHGRCCLDGYHCCPYGLDCDLTYTHCVRQGLRYPFTPRQAPAFQISSLEDKVNQETPMTALTETSGVASETGVIRCDDKSYCPPGNTCCKGPKGQWGCCPVL